MTPKDMQKLSVKSQIKKYGGKDKYREEMKKRSAMGVEAKKLSTPLACNNLTIGYTLSIEDNSKI